MGSIIKTLTMLLGEYDFEDNFLYDAVKKNMDSNFSVQILLLIFIAYGSLILMNVLVALMITKTDEQDAQISLIKQRIEEISGTTDVITRFFCRFFCRKQK